MSNRMGRVPDIDKFDSSFFGIMGQMVEMMDPESRFLMEATYEALIDAGNIWAEQIETLENKSFK